MTKTAGPFRAHLKNASSLETPYEATRAGFVALALEKNRRANPFIAQARALKVQAAKARRAEELLTMAHLRPAVLTAAGLSDKAKGHLTDDDKTKAVKEFIDEFLRPAGARFVEELVYRFLLTRGDTLGGSMRNIIGAAAERKVTAAIVSVLALRETGYTCQDARGNWSGASSHDASGNAEFKGLSWCVRGEPRTVVFNRRVPLVRNNVDLCLLRTYADGMATALQAPEQYIALGELKGGIDPAGADEHWKTAHSALNRIAKAFGDRHLTPATFFIGAAIEESMASEIWAMLENGALANAANLTDDDQLTSLCDWLCSL
jgi:hypothetical protein